MMLNKSVKMFLLVLVFSVALYGCSGKRNETNLVTIGITQDLDSLDPHKAVAAGTKEVLFNIYEGLIKLDHNQNLVPAVARDYDISLDGMVYTFHIREGIKFHHGEEVTAKDIEYSIKRSAGMLDTVDKAIVVERALLAIQEVNILDVDTVEVVLKYPDTEILYYLSRAFIVPENYEQLSSIPIGTGPFKFVSYSPLESLIMERYEDYYIEGVPSLDRVVFKITANTDAAFLELRAGTIDILPYLTDAQADQVPDGYYVEEGSMNLIQGIFLNNEREPFDDIKVRKALSFAIDRQGVIDLVAGGKGDVLGTNMFPGFKNYYDETLVNVYPRDINKAKKLLAEAGYPDGFSFVIKVPSNYQYHVDTAQIVVEQLKEVGIDAQIQLIEWATWLSDVYNDRDYQATLSGLAAEVAPRKALERFRSDAGNNFMNYKDEEFDELYQLAEKETREEEKIKLYKKMQEKLTMDAVAVYIQDPYQLAAVSDKLGGYTYYPIYVQDMSLIYFKED